ncbi:MAG: hypothetical protein GX683_00970, partial [Ruminococcaceae bacterium]|nr:hypothetical protein [Oscillospiraceae bacterium]
MQNDLKVTFFSNFLNAHQLPFCNAMSDLFGEGFKFVATEHSDGAGVSAGIKDISEEHSFCVCSYASDEAADIALKLAKESDVVIIGSAPEKYFLESVRNAVGGKLVFRYSERLFKPMYGRCIKWHSYLALQALLNRFRNYFLLSAGSYAAEDFQKLLMPKNRMFKWGYFPVILKCGEADYAVFKENKKPRILWAGRMLDWK